MLCRFGECCKEMLPKNAAEHERQHTGEKPYVCAVPGCGVAHATRRGTVYHRMSVHTGERPYVCNVEWCGARFVQKCELDGHNARTHTERGVQRRKRREEALATFLTSLSIPFDRELIVPFCGEGTKKLARVDFVIYKADRVVVVECDERFHQHYGVLCDVTRMLDIAAQHAQRSELPLHFVRFNPDEYEVDGRSQKPKMGARYRELLLAIEEPVSSPLAITYICYPTTGNTADVTRSDEFPPELREVCKCRVP